MALKAGYKGVKKSVLDSLLSLLGSLVIKDVGDGLTLDSDGELSTDIDTSTMEFKDGKLAARITRGFSLTTLFEGGYQNPAPYNTNVTILGDNDILDYDLLLFSITSSQETGGGAGHIGTWQYLADPKILSTTDRNIISVFADRLIFLSLTGDKTFTYKGEGGQLPYIMYIYGLKF